jgi:predicted ABC-type ATPase
MESALAVKPQLLLVGGPNGSGKTTVALEYSDEHGLPYLSADAIAAALNPSNPPAADFAAARQFIEKLEQYISQQTSFVCESTLSGLTMRNFIRTARDAEFSINVAFLFVESPDVCVARVAERVRKGGHHVPEADIRRRFTRSLRNFWRIYRELADSWVLLYNGATALQDVLAGSQLQLTVRNPLLFSTYLELIAESR